VTWIAARNKTSVLRCDIHLNWITDTVHRNRPGLAAHCSEYCVVIHPTVDERNGQGYLREALGLS
jgi:hypothetical protein